MAVVIGAAALVGLALSTSASGFSGYVSEAGVPGSPLTGLYRLSVFAVGATAALLAALIWPQSRQMAVAFGLAAPMVGLSGMVTCTQGCPLPPYEPTTTQDLIHAGASLIGVGCCALAMLAGSWWATGRLPQVSRLGLAVAWPFLGATAIGMMAVGRGLFTGVFERLGLLACLLWMLALAVVTGRPARPSGT